MSTTTHIKIIQLDENQSQKHVTINTALEKIDDELDKSARRLIVTLYNGSTPSAAGADPMEYVVPYLSDGTSVTYEIVRAVFRQSTTGSGASQVKPQYSTGTGIFSAIELMNSPFLQAAIGAYEVSSTSFINNTINSGNKIRAYTVAKGTGSGGYLLELTLRQVNNA